MRNNPSVVFYAFVLGISILNLPFCSQSLLQKNKNSMPTPSASSSPQLLPPSPPIQRDFVSIIHYSNEPIALLDAQLTNPQVPAQSDMHLTVQNVSGKSVKFVQYSMLPAERCTEFMYTGVPVPRIGYGDWSVRGESEKANPNQPPLNPNDKAQIVVKNDDYLSHQLNPKTYASCPEGYRKPELMLVAVYFTDGTNWDVNTQERESH
jgi:hypothetical protein